MSDSNNPKAFKQVFSIHGATKSQTAAAKAIAKRANDEGKISAGSAMLGAAAAGAAAAKSTSFFAGLVTAAPVVVEGGTVVAETTAAAASIAALTVTEGTLLASVVTIGGPILVGGIAGLATWAAAKKLGQLIINMDGNNDIQKEIDAGHIDVAADNDDAKARMKDGTALWTGMKIRETDGKSTKSSTKDTQAANEASGPSGSPKSAAS